MTRKEKRSSVFFLEKNMGKPSVAAPGDTNLSDATDVRCCM